MNFSILLNQIFIFALLISVGIFAIRTKIINNETKDGIARLVIDITMPLLIFFSIINMELSSEIAKNSLVFIYFSYISTFLLLFSAFFITKKMSTSKKEHFHLPSENKSITIVQTIFGNCVFFGFPFFDILFPGGVGLFYAILYYVVQASVLWTIGIFILDDNRLNTGKKNKNIFDSIKHNLIKILNPNTIAFILGLIFLFFDLSVIKVVETSLNGLGKTSLYLSMIYIGATIGQMRIKEDILKYSIPMIISVNKMIITPIIMLLMFLIIRLFIEIDSTVITIIVLETGMPIMTLLVVLAKKYNHNITFATENLFISTIFSLITLPFLYFLVTLLL